MAIGYSVIFAGLSSASVAVSIFVSLNITFPEEFREIPYAWLWLEYDKVAVRWLTFNKEHVNNTTSINGVTLLFFFIFYVAGRYTIISDL